MCVSWVGEIWGFIYPVGRREQVACCFTRGEINLTGVSSSRRGSSQKQTSVGWLHSCGIRWLKTPNNNPITHTHTHTHPHSHLAQGRQPTAVSSLAAAEQSRSSSWRQCCFLISGDWKVDPTFLEIFQCNSPYSCFWHNITKVVLQPSNSDSISLSEE